MLKDIFRERHLFERKLNRIKRKVRARLLFKRFICLVTGKDFQVQSRSRHFQIKILEKYFNNNRNLLVNLLFNYIKKPPYIFDHDTNFTSDFWWHKIESNLELACISNLILRRDITEDQLFEIFCRLIKLKLKRENQPKIMYSNSHNNYWNNYWTYIKYYCIIFLILKLVGVSTGTFMRSNINTPTIFEKITTLNPEDNLYLELFIEDTFNEIKLFFYFSGEVPLSCLVPILKTLKLKLIDRIYRDISTNYKIIAK